MAGLPKRKRLNRNLCPRLLFNWKIVICVAAPSTKRARKVAVTGISMFLSGNPPDAQIIGRYGGPLIWTLSAYVQVFSLSKAKVNSGRNNIVKLSIVLRYLACTQGRECQSDLDRSLRAVEITSL